MLRQLKDTIVGCVRRSSERPSSLRRELEVRVSQCLAATRVRVDVREVPPHAHDVINEQSELIVGQMLARLPQPRGEVRLHVRELGFHQWIGSGGR